MKTKNRYKILVDGEYKFVSDEEKDTGEIVESRVFLYPKRGKILRKENGEETQDGLWIEHTSGIQRIQRIKEYQSVELD